MVAVISVVIFGLIFAFFATLNTSPVTINLWYTTWTNVPLYIAVLASLAAGILLSAVFYLGKSIADYFKIGSTEHELKKTKQTITFPHVTLFNSLNRCCAPNCFARRAFYEAS